MTVTNEAAGDDPEIGDAPNSYACLEDFVREHVSVHCARRIDGRTRVWSARWWDVPEAVLRLRGMWEAWEELRGVPGGASLWLRDHADYHLGILFSPDGPFEASPDTRDTTNRRGERLPCAPAPPDHHVRTLR